MCRVLCTERLSSYSNPRPVARITSRSPACCVAPASPWPPPSRLCSLSTALPTRLRPAHRGETRDFPPNPAKGPSPHRFWGRGTMSQPQSRQSEYGQPGLPPPPPPPLQHYPPHLAYAHSGDGTANSDSNSNPYHHLQRANAADDDRSSPEQGSYSIVPQTRSRPTSPEGVTGSPDRKRYMGMNGRDGGGGARENDPALRDQGTTPPDPGVYSGGGSGPGGGGGGGGSGDTTTGGGLKNGGGATSKRSKASANLTTNGTATAGGSAPSTGGQAPPLKRGNACNICRKRKLVRPLFRWSLPSSQAQGTDPSAPTISRCLA